MALWIVDLLVLLLGVPVAMFAIECVLGILTPGSKKCLALPEGLCTAILVPAHNEETVIRATLRSLQQQIGENDHIVVIADNCTDKTARIVRETGVTAIERSSDDERGKGYALAHGIRYLNQQNTLPDVVVIVDADCLLAEGTLTLLKHHVVTYERPVQACYLMKRGSIDRIGIKVSEFAFMVKNKIRLRGLSHMAMPVPLTGTGMAFPWRAISEANLATGDIVEDMRLGVELVEQGMGATYCDEAEVYSFFPTSDAAEKTQRERWEHGHLNTLRQFAPRLFKRAIGKPSLEALGMMLDLIIPPLSLLVISIASVWVCCMFWGFFSADWSYAFVSASYLILLVIVVLVMWISHGRQILSVKELAHIPVYILLKIVVYVGYVVRKQTKWIRTDRH